jgi:hypothetical protein
MADLARHAPDTELSLDQVATMARVSREAVDTAVRNRALRAHQRQGQWVVLVADVRRWLSRR